ncbi:DUF1413 domain-containing protein [Poseidonocella sp. HB161398]|uniref:DUF1413 domain-containing protein n=1 Tax=Poseidonocella sp. HB161398 TaxID=2320855 RepID=UPI001107FB01|nr:DUF1413 domain-containing protein [Poseidonocella sp. HB161398]
MTGTDRARIAAALAARQPGEFRLPELLADWEDRPIGEKVRLGNDFLREVRKGAFAGIRDTGRKAPRGHLYRKED